MRRGAVQINLRIDRPRRADDYRLNTVALASYRDQLRRLDVEGGSTGDAVNLGALLALPGVVEEVRTAACETLMKTGPRSPRWSAKRSTGWKPRAQEGRVMAGELQSLGRSIQDQLVQIAARGPLVVPAYQSRLVERISALVQAQGVTVEPKDLIREVAILADRSDISEEIVRLRAHLVQYQETLVERKRRTKARIRRPGNGPRDEHHRVQGQRRRDQP